MEKEEYLQQMKDVLIRIEGTINILHKPDVILAHRRLQGLRDKVRHMIHRTATSDKFENTSLEDHIQEVTTFEENNKD